MNGTPSLAQTPNQGLRPPTKLQPDHGLTSKIMEVFEPLIGQLERHGLRQPDANGKVTAREELIHKCYVTFLGRGSFSKTEAEGILPQIKQLADLVSALKAGNQPGSLLEKAINDVPKDPKLEDQYWAEKLQKEDFWFTVDSLVYEQRKLSHFKSYCWEDDDFTKRVEPPQNITPPEFLDWTQGASTYSGVISPLGKELSEAALTNPGSKKTVSGHKCKREVADIVGAVTRYRPEGDGALSSIPYFRKHTSFKEVSITPDKVNLLPAGSVIVYNNSDGWGHICLKAVDDNGNVTWVSDFRQKHALINQQGRREIKAAFIPVDSEVLVATAATAAPDTPARTSNISSGRAQEVPYFWQSDPRWSNVDYGRGSTIGKGGCGPTTMAMILRGYGINVSPIEAARYSLENGFRASEGTVHTFFPSYAKHFGLNAINCGQQLTKIIGHLEQGHLVAAWVRGQPFSTQGHAIAITGFDRASNTFFINNPAYPNRKTATPAELQRALQRSSGGSYAILPPSNLQSSDVRLV